jgi:hypothetical protein
MTMPATLSVRLNARNTALIVAALIGVQILLLRAMGHPFICPCGYVKLWHGITHSPENSQQILDWYSLTHIVHGFAIYAALWWLWRDGSVAARLIVAVLIEGGWEVLENSQFVIDRYRAQTVWREYYGDSIINSVSDTCMMIIGFMLAARLPVLASVAAVAAMEFGLIFLIGDSLFLNIVMLIHPFEKIKAWQATFVP